LTHLERLATDPGRADLFLLPARAFFEAGDAQTARLLASHTLEILPDCLPAYLFLAESLRALNERDEAIRLLESVIALPGAQEAGLGALLIELHDEAGDLESATRLRLRFSGPLEDDLRAFFALTQGADETALTRQRQKIAAKAPTRAFTGQPPARRTLVFWLHDLEDPAQTEVLAALARYLPRDWAKFVILADPSRPGVGDDAFNLAHLLADALFYLPADGDDAVALEWLQRHPASALIDLDPRGQIPRPRIAAQAPVARKLGIGDVPLPFADWQALDCRGVFYPMPEVPLAETPPATQGIFCATPVGRLDAAGWQSLVALWQAVPEATLTLSLAGLGEAAKSFARQQLQKAGIDPARLVFWAGGNREDLCWLLREMAVAIALPGYDDSYLAALWMGRPAFSLVPGDSFAASGLAVFCATPACFVERLQSILTAPPAADLALRQKLVQMGIQDGARLARRFMLSIEGA
jgi:hypothetical protein